MYWGNCKLEMKIFTATLISQFKCNSILFLDKMFKLTVTNL